MLQVYKLEYTNVSYNSDPHTAYNPNFKRLLCPNTSKDVTSDSLVTQKAPRAARSALLYAVYAATCSVDTVESTWTVGDPLDGFGTACSIML